MVGDSQRPYQQPPEPDAETRQAYETLQAYLTQEAAKLHIAGERIDELLHAVKEAQESGQAHLPNSHQLIESIDSAQDAQQLILDLEQRLGLRKAG